MTKIETFNKFSIITLENGLKALIYPREEVNSISIFAIIRAGHLCEKVEQNGIAHILEHMLFDGTEKFVNFKKLNNFFDQIAGEFVGTTSYDFITIGGIFVDEELENALLALNQILFHPLLKKEFLEKEKGIIIDELSTLEDNNDYINFIKAKKARFDDNSILSFPMGGTSESVQKVTHKQVKSFYRKFFRPDNINLIIVGKCNQNKVHKLIKKSFASHALNSKMIHSQFNSDLFSDKKISLTNKPSEKVYMRITFPSYSWKNKTVDRVTLAYLCSLLSNRRDSILYSHLREKLGWIYDINSSFLVGFDIGVFEIETSTPINKSLKVVKEILKAIKKVKTTKFNREFFERVKDIDRKRMKMAFDTPNSILKWFSEEIFYRYPKVLMPSELLKIYNKITTSDIIRVANEIFDLEKINITILQPFDKSDKKSYKEKVDALLVKYK